jgi:hypothetical protein
MEIERQALERHVCVAQFEKSLLEDYAEHFFSQKFSRSVVGQIHRQSISGFDVRKLILFWWSREFEQIERAVDGVDGEEARLVFAAKIVVDAIETEGHVDLGDALERAEAESAEQCGGAEGGEFLEGGGLGDGGL